MRNRPLLGVCLVILCVMTFTIFFGGERFVKELQPSPLETYVTDGESVTVCGTIYRREYKEKCQMIYLKDNSVYSNSDKYQFQESKIIIYANSNEKLQIGNQVRVQGSVSFYENARNPGNFDQKFYYQKQGIHGLVWADHIQKTEDTVNKRAESLFQFRSRWKQILIRELGEKDGASLAAILIGEKNGMDQETKELYRVNGIGHILAISGVKTQNLAIPITRRTRINSAFMPLHIAKIYILKLCLDEEIILRCRFPCSRGYFRKCINWQKKQ